MPTSPSPSVARGDGSAGAARGALETGRRADVATPWLPPAPGPCGSWVTGREVRAGGSVDSDARPLGGVDTSGSLLRSLGVMVSSPGIAVRSVAGWAMLAPGPPPFQDQPDVEAGVSLASSVRAGAGLGRESRVLGSASGASVRGPRGRGERGAGAGAAGVVDGSRAPLETRGGPSGDAVVKGSVHSSAAVLPSARVLG